MTEEISSGAAGGAEADAAAREAAAAMSSGGMDPLLPRAGEIHARPAYAGLGIMQGGAWALDRAGVDSSAGRPSSMDRVEIGSVGLNLGAIHEAKRRLTS